MWWSWSQVSLIGMVGGCCARSDARDRERSQNADKDGQMTYRRSPRPHQPSCRQRGLQRRSVSRCDELARILVGRQQHTIVHELGQRELLSFLLFGSCIMYLVSYLSFPACALRGLSQCPYPCLRFVFDCWLRALIGARSRRDRSSGPQGLVRSREGVGWVR